MQNGTDLGGEGSGVGDQDRVGAPVSTKNFLDLPATSCCTLGSSPVMVSVTGELAGVGCFSSVEPS